MLRKYHLTGKPQKRKRPCRPRFGYRGVAKLHEPENTEDAMTTRKKVARRKLSLLDLVVDMGNMSKACKIMGSSRQQFYETRRNYQTVGSERLFNRLPGPKEPHPNRVEEQVKTCHPGLFPESFDPWAASGRPVPGSFRNSCKFRRYSRGVEPP